MLGDFLMHDDRKFSILINLWYFNYNRSRGGKNEKLLRYISSNNERMQKKE